MHVRTMLCSKECSIDAGAYVCAASFCDSERIACSITSWLDKRAGQSQNRAKMHEESTKIAEKTVKFRSWTFLGAQSHLGDTPGRAPEGTGTPKKYPGTDLGTPRASQECPGPVQKHSQAGAETVLDDPGVLPECVWCTEHC